MFCLIITLVFLPSDFACVCNESDGQISATHGVCVYASVGRQLYGFGAHRRLGSCFTRREQVCDLLMKSSACWCCVESKFCGIDTWVSGLSAAERFVTYGSRSRLVIRRRKRENVLGTDNVRPLGCSCLAAEMSIIGIWDTHSRCRAKWKAESRSEYRLDRGWVEEPRK